MDLHLDNHLALIAGSSRGIGKAIANAFLSEGCRVAITGRDEKSLHDTFSEFASVYGPNKVMACEGDLQQSETIDKTLTKIHQHWGDLDYLIANIGNGETPAWNPVHRCRRSPVARVESQRWRDDAEGDG